MTAPGSVTCWLDGLRAGDGAAAQHLWEGYFRRLVGLARRKLGGAAPGPAGAEDVALSAFVTFCRGAGRGRFPRLADRADLWQVLVVLTARKAADVLRAEAAQKRGGRARAGGADLRAVVGREPTPSFAAQVVDECRRLLDRLDADLRALAQLKMEGYTNAEIADQVGRSLATVERKLKLIRRIWQGEAPDA
jgi:DNA-directed RNA polymerase specialized sigma24 family protein